MKQFTIQFNRNFNVYSVMEKGRIVVSFSTREQAEKWVEKYADF